MKGETSQEFHSKCTTCGSLKNFRTWKISMKVQTPREFYIKCSSEYARKNKLLKGFVKNVPSLDLWKIWHSRNCDDSSNFSGVSSKNVLSVNLWKILHSEKIDERPNFSRISSKYTKCEPLKMSTLRKHRWKSELLKSFIENVLRLDLWKIPHSENIDGRSNLTRVSSKCTKYRPLKNSTFRKYRWKTKLLKGFVKNVLSVNLWKIWHSGNCDDRSNFSRVSSKMYWVWTSEKFDTQEISMKDQTSQGFHQK